MRAAFFPDMIAMAAAPSASDMAFLP